MEKLINMIFALSTNDPDDLKQLYTHLRKSEEWMFNNLPILDEVLLALDIGRNSLGYLVVLYVTSFIFLEFCGPHWKQLVLPFLNVCSSGA